jgi:hypothetical protein
MNLCNNRRMNANEKNVTCYLVDEHGIVILSNSRRQSVGLPLHKVNPWLMLQLEIENIYTLIIPGKNLEECSKPPITANSAQRLFNIINSFFKIITLLFVHSMNSILINVDNFRIVVSETVETLTTTPPPVTKSIISYLKFSCLFLFNSFIITNNESSNNRPKIS